MKPSVETEVKLALAEKGKKQIDQKQIAAAWFHEKWGVPKEAYSKCMTTYLNRETEYGWEFLCMVQGDREPEMTRMYIHR